MNERVVEILVFIMNQIRGNKANLTKLEVISKDLLNKGYSQNEISSAFSWLFEKIQNNFEEILKNTEASHEYSFRVLHDLETMILSPKAYGYLLQLKELGIFDDIDIEQAIERAMLLGTATVDLEEVKSIVAYILALQSQGGNGNYFVNNHSQLVH